jgi:putative CocE/NonD family hydrolase
MLSVRSSAVRRIVVLALVTSAACVGLIPSHATTTGWQPRAATYPHQVVLADQKMLMSDGVSLYSDVYLPSYDGKTRAPGRFPTGMIITPYNKNGQVPAPIDINYLTSRGYAFVVAEVRGTGNSPGIWEYGSTREHLDGYEEVEWAARQPWSTGAVGTVGDSYRGFNQWWTAALQPPHLRAMVPINAPADMYRSGGDNGGEASSLIAAQGLVLGFGVQPGKQGRRHPTQEAQILGSRGLAAANAGLTTLDIVDGGDRSYDGPYYHFQSGYWNVDKIRTPALLVGGWYDIAQRDMPLMFSEMQARGVPTKLVMGPWYHTTFGAGLPSPGLPYNLDELVLRWFDRYLAGRSDPGLGSFGPVVYETQGEGVFHSATSWPPSNVTYKRLYLSGTSVPGRVAALRKAAPTGTQRADLLPWQPVSGACSRSASQALLGLDTGYVPEPCNNNGAFNDATGLAYDVKAGSQGMRFAGPIAADLYVSTTGTDGFVDVRVEDVAPNGGVSALTDGIDTLSFRALDQGRTLVRNGMIVRPFHPYTKASMQFVRRGQIYRWSIEVLPTSAYIAPGHSLRVTIQPADAAQSVMTAPHAPRMVGSVMSIYHDAAHPSSIALPFQ